MQLGVLFDKTVGEWAAKQARIITGTASPLKVSLKLRVCKNNLRFKRYRKT